MSTILRGTVSAGMEETELTRLLADATCSGKDFSLDHQNVIVTIGKGMFWSRAFDQAARKLAAKIERELETCSNSIL